MKVYCYIHTACQKLFDLIEASYLQLALYIYHIPNSLYMHRDDSFGVDGVRRLLGLDARYDACKAN